MPQVDIYAYIWLCNESNNTDLQIFHLKFSVMLNTEIHTEYLGFVLICPYFNLYLSHWQRRTSTLTNSTYIPCEHLRQGGPTRQN